MPRLAVLSDLHANLAACQAVAADLRRRQPDQVLVLGDLVGYLTRPNQVVELVRRAGWQCLAGNYDQAVLSGGQAGVDTFLKPGIGPEPRAVFAWTEAAVDPASRAFLAGLPQRINLEMAGQALLAVHGSPAGVRHYVHPDHPDAELQAWLTRAGAGVLLMGHTHVPFIRQLPAGLVLNPGSVGKSKDGDPRASYALIDFLPQPQAQIIRLEYDPWSRRPACCMRPACPPAPWTGSARASRPPSSADSSLVRRPRPCSGLPNRPWPRSGPLARIGPGPPACRPPRKASPCRMQCS